MHYECRICVKIAFHFAVGCAQRYAVPLASCNEYFYSYLDYILSIGGSRGGRQGRAPPPLGKNEKC